MRAVHIKRRVVAAVSSVALAVGVFSPLATAGGEPQRTLFGPLGYEYFPHAQPPEENFSGDIFSRRKSCTEGRKVTVFRELRDADERIGSTRFSGTPQSPDPPFEPYWENYWLLDVNNPEPGRETERGRYYAKTKATEACGGDTSPVEQVP